MAKSYPVIERSGGRVTVLARSAAEAHGAATDALGTGCTIVSVDKVRSGGLGGFFATELVRLVASAPGAGPSGGGAPPVPGGDALFTLPGGGEEFAARLASELAALTRTGTAAAEATLAEVIRPDLMPGPTARRALPAERGGSALSAASFTDDDVLPGDDALRWAESSEVPAAAPRPAEEELAIDWRSVFAAQDDAAGGPPADEDGAAGAPSVPAWSVGPDTADGTDQVGSDAGHDPGDVAGIAEARTGGDQAQPGEDDPAEDPLPAWFSAEPAGDDPFAGTAALLAEMLDAEYGLEDRTITQRASAIRRGEPLPGTDRPGAPRGDGEAEEAGGVPGAIPCPGADQPAGGDPTPGWGLPHGDPSPRATVDPGTATGSPVPAWSAPTLRAFGVPDTVVGRIDRRVPVDDLDWIVGFMLAVRDLCGPLPDEALVLAGPGCAALAQHLGVPVTGEDDAGSVTGSVAVPDAGPLGLRRCGAGRGIHLVVGGGWHHLAPVRPAVVSAAGPDGLLEALRVAEAWGATLGWVGMGGGQHRIDPYVLAGKLRAMLPLAPEPRAAGAAPGRP